jgi:hypothetical protein
MSALSAVGACCLSAGPKVNANDRNLVSDPQLTDSIAGELNPIGSFPGLNHCSVSERPKTRNVIAQEGSSDG